MLNYDDNLIKNVVQQYKDDMSKIPLSICNTINKELQNTLEDTSALITAGYRIFTME